MRPASSSARTRRRHGGAEMPARRASSTLVIRPSACRSRRIRRSILSSLTCRILFSLPARHPPSVKLYCPGGGHKPPFRRNCRVPPLPGLMRCDTPPAMPDDIERRTPAARGGAPLVWALHDGRIGIENQVLGLAEALRLPFLARRFAPRFPWSWLPPALWPPLADAATAASDRLTAPWPDLLISCGRLCAAAAIAAKRASGGRVFIAQIQDPRLGRRHFDLMVVPQHDPARGANVFVTRGAVHRVTAERLAAAGRRFAPLLAHLPRPLVAVLIGGRNR